MLELHIGRVWFENRAKVAHVKSYALLTGRHFEVELWLDSNIILSPDVVEQALVIQHKSKI